MATRGSPLLPIAERLVKELAPLRFAAPVTHVYNPLEYAWNAHRDYLDRFGRGKKRVVFVGMNPGPWGMAQTGVPFGEVSMVRDWMGIDASVSKPKNEHPKRPIEGFACKRSEVSGARLWGWIREKFGSPEDFFSEFFVANYCPLVFMEESGKNRTPDKLRPEERARLTSVCDRAFRAAVDALQPEIVVGVGAWAEKRATEALAGMTAVPKIGRILHPSPASPLANAGWGDNAAAALRKLGIDVP